MENKPNHYLIFKIIGFIGIIVSVIGLVLVFTGFGNFENNNFMLGGFMFTFGMAGGIGCLMVGFRPQIAKMQIQSMKHIQEQNKQDMIDIANNTADITKTMITKTTQAVAEGLNNTMYCKHCGAQIDSDSKFCNKCGKEQ